MTIHAAVHSEIAAASTFGRSPRVPLVTFSSQMPSSTARSITLKAYMPLKASERPFSLLGSSLGAIGQVAQPVCSRSGSTTGRQDGVEVRPSLFTSSFNVEQCSLRGGEIASSFCTIRAPTHHLVHAGPLFANSPVSGYTPAVVYSSSIAMARCVPVAD